MAKRIFGNWSKSEVEKKKRGLVYSYWDAANLVSNRVRSWYEMRLLPQGLEKYSRDQGFDQNSVRDSGKLKIS